MADYRYHFFNWSTREYVDTLPLENVSFTSELRGVGEFSGDIPLGAEQITPRRVLDTALAYRTKIFVERGQALVWGGWLHQVPDFDSGTGRLTIAAQETLGYFESRYMPTVSYLSTDQLTIARSIIAAAQAVPYGDMWLVPDVATSGVVRDRVFSQYDYTEVLGALTELSEIEGGFEFASAVGWDSSGAPAEQLRLGYPRLGRTGEAAGLVLEYNRYLAEPGNVASYTWQGGPGFATRAHAVTETDEGVRLISATDNTEAFAAGYPLVETSANIDGATTQSTVDKHAAALAKVSARPRVAPTFTVRAGPGTELGDFALGDDMLVRLTDHRFPPQEGGGPGFVATVRVTGLEVTPGPPETYVLTMGEVLSFQ